MLVQELQRLEPDARPLKLGTHRVWTWDVVVPAHTFTNVFLPLADEKAIQLTARSGFSSDLSRSLLNLVSRWEGLDIQAKTLSVLPGLRSGTDFDQAGIAPPNVANRFEHESDYLRKRCFWVFPCYSGEFRSGQDESEFDATIRRSGNVSVVEWDRLPAPHIKFQLLDPWPGGMLAKRKKPVQLPFRILSSYLWELPVEKTRILLHDISGRALVVIHKKGGLVFCGEFLPAPQIVTGRREATDRLMSFLRGKDF